MVLPVYNTLAIFLIALRGLGGTGRVLGLGRRHPAFHILHSAGCIRLAPHRTKLDQLLERRDAIYDNLRDLRFEYRSGKYSEGDFEADEDDFWKMKRRWCWPRSIK